jgi:hypothetical protein
MADETIAIRLTVNTKGLTDNMLHALQGMQHTRGGPAGAGAAGPMISSLT